MISDAQAGRYKQTPVISRIIGHELILYRNQTHTAHCLNEVAREIWLSCEQESSLAQVVGQVRTRWPGIEEDSVAEALRNLVSAGLVEEISVLTNVSNSRRQAVRKLITAAAMLPVITSILVPTANAAQSPPHGTSRTRQRGVRGRTS
jgi:hypothetical protein